MPPKKPSELRKQLREQAKQPSKPGHERTAEGLEVPIPSESDFFANLRKASKPDEG